MHLRFSKGVEQDLSVTVSHISEAENGRVVVVLKGNTYLPELTLLRQQSAEVILGSLEGIRGSPGRLYGRKRPRWMKTVSWSPQSRPASIAWVGHGGPGSNPVEVLYSATACSGAVRL